ncbi:MAG TPA: putative Ig domain-containing protein [Solirubrobacteraceae bacterium]|nr:putative Ig domain-containing protein [Solirubrobacteraceae bacterium]
MFRSAAVAVALVSAAVLAQPGAALAGARSGVGVTFGEGAYGQLGAGAVEMANPTPRVLAPFEHEAEKPGPEPGERELAADQVARLPIIAAAAGANFSLAVTAEGVLFSFGSNRFRQLALDWEDGRATPASPVDQPLAAELPLKSGDGVVAQVAAGSGDGFAVTTTGALFGWGVNNHGQAGVKTDFDAAECSAPPAEGIDPKPIRLPGEERAAQVAAGRFFTLVRTQAGRVFGFGSNLYGQLGNSTYFQQECGALGYEAQEVDFPPQEGGERITDVAAGWDFSLAVTAGGRLFAFGLGEYGATGRESPLPSDEPAEVTLGGERVARVAAGEHFALIVTRSGALYALGQNRFGQLGTEQGAGTGAADAEARRVALPADAGRVVHAAAGEESSLVVTESGRLYTFGENDFGQLGWLTSLAEPSNPTVTFGTNTPNWLPQQVTLPGSLRAEDVALGALAKHALVVAGEPGIRTPSLRVARVGAGYRTVLAAAGGQAPYTWSASGLPAGIRLEDERGILTGRPRRAGIYTVHLAAVDAFGIRSTATLRMKVQSRGPGIVDLRISPRRWREDGRVTFRLTARATVHVHVCVHNPRGCRPFAAIDEHVRRGRVRLVIARRMRIAGRRLAPGAYELYLTAADGAGTTSSPRIPFTVG